MRSSDRVWLLASCETYENVTEYEMFKSKLMQNCTIFAKILGFFCEQMHCLSSLQTLDKKHVRCHSGYKPRPNACATSSRIITSMAGFLWTNDDRCTYRWHPLRDGLCGDFHRLFWNPPKPEEVFNPTSGKPRDRFGKPPVIFCPT